MHSLRRTLLALTLTTLVASAPSAVSRQSMDWGSIWADAARLEAMDAGAEGARDLRALLEGHLVDPLYEGDARRCQLLRARLEAWDGSVTQKERLALSRVALGDWSRTEGWMVAAALLPGPVRAQLVLKLISVPAELTREQQILAWETGVAEARALRLKTGALPIQVSLHERYRAGWTGYDLSQTLRRLGDRERLGSILFDVIEQEEAAGRSSAELWSAWGIATLGFGDESRARDYLGRALAGGSADAALVLGKMDLDAGHLADARMNFRPSILTRAPSPWALRGWGMTLLPSARTNPKGAESSAQHD